MGAVTAQSSINISLPKFVKEGSWVCDPDIEASVLALRAAVTSGDISSAVSIWRKIKANIFVGTTAIFCDDNSENKDFIHTVSVLREALECACLIHLEYEDLNGFNKCFTLLQPCYTDFIQSTLPQSQNEAPLTAVHLLYLVALGRLGDLRVFLQRLSKHVIAHSDVTFVIEVEQYFTAGNYEKCVKAVTHPPNKYLKLICNSLIDSIRMQVADTLRKSHKRISIERITKLLMIESRLELEALVTKMNIRGSSARNEDREDIEYISDEAGVKPRDVYSWSIEGDHIRFSTVTDNRKQVRVQELMNYVLNYAAELEKIV